jgi:hypothetical protein
MGNTSFVKILQSKNNFGDVIACPFFRQATEHLDQSSAIATIEILHHQIKVISALESPKELHNER